MTRTDRQTDWRRTKRNTYCRLLWERPHYNQTRCKACHLACGQATTTRQSKNVEARVSKQLQRGSGLRHQIKRLWLLKQAAVCSGFVFRSASAPASLTWQCMTNVWQLERAIMTYAVVLISLFLRKLVLLILLLERRLLDSVWQISLRLLPDFHVFMRYDSQYFRRRRLIRQRYASSRL